MIYITSDPLNPQEVTDLVCKGSNGAVITFLGTTRDFSEGRDVLYLEYEAYQPMAENMLRQIVEEVRYRGHGHCPPRWEAGDWRDQFGGGPGLTSSQGGL